MTVVSGRYQVSVKRIVYLQLELQQGNGSLLLLLGSRLLGASLLTWVRVGAEQCGHEGELHCPGSGKV
jgi:hypothetical protein